MHVERTVREALGLAYNPDAGSVMRALLRAAGIQPPMFTVPNRCEDWFVDLANMLVGYASEDATPQFGPLDVIADHRANALHAALAPAMLAVIAPHAQAPDCFARELPGKCKKMVREELSAFCARIVAQWRDGALANGPLPAA